MHTKLDLHVLTSITIIHFSLAFKQKEDRKCVIYNL